MKFKVVEDFNKDEQIAVIDIEFPNIFEVECLEDLDGVDNQLAVGMFDSFYVNAYALLRKHGFEIFEDTKSDNDQSLSRYIFAFKGEDFEKSDIKVMVHIRLSDHRMNMHKWKLDRRNHYYDTLSQEYKMPTDKSHQDWEFYDVVANGHEVSDYSDALNKLDSILGDIEQRYYGVIAK